MQQDYEFVKGWTRENNPIPLINTQQLVNHRLTVYGNTSIK